jgi:nitroimidazol reductase NimA-like FMN-containing flavoprotein (pyridoxamine 5'-phosphate oxidase superfamily)
VYFDRMTDLLAPSARTEVRRSERASYDRSTIYSILDEALICHVGFVADEQPFVIPTIHARIDDRLYIHGAPAARMLKTLRGGVPVCVTVTLLDGLVLARSAFHHSMNYRSAVVLGRAREVVDAEEKVSSFRALVEHVVRGRWADCRRPTNKEFAKTQVLGLPIDEASAKVRSGPPIDDDEDHALEHWAGEIPLRLTSFAAIDDPLLATGIARPSYVDGYRRGE